MYICTTEFIKWTCSFHLQKKRCTVLHIFTQVLFWTGNQGNHCNVTDLNGDGTKQKFGNNKFKIGGFKNGILFPKLFWPTERHLLCERSVQSLKQNTFSTSSSGPLSQRFLRSNTFKSVSNYGVLWMGLNCDDNSVNTYVNICNTVYVAIYLSLCHLSRLRSFLRVTLFYVKNGLLFQ